MALCQYCGKVEIAWHQGADRRWVACEAMRDATGAVVRAVVKNGAGGKTANRPVPDPAKRHYPHAPAAVDAAGEPVPPAPSECPAWTAEGAKERKGKGRGWSAPRPMVVSAAEDVEATTITLPPVIPAGVVVTIPVAAPIGGWGADKIVAPAPKPQGPRRVREPEELMDAADVAAWRRAEAIVLCPIIPTRVLLWGPPGTGKTEMPWRVAKAQGWQHVYQLMTEETPGTELLGHLIVQGGSTVWCDGTLGRAIRASQTGHVVYVVDEIARASQDAMSACLLALTNPESLRLTLRSGEVLEPNPANWHVVATSNDDPGQLPPALADRLHMSVRLLAPHPDLVRSMVTAEARQLATSKAREYSVRALLTYDRLRAGGMSLEDAAGMVWEPEVAQSFRDAARLEGGFDYVAAAPAKVWQACDHKLLKCRICKGPCCEKTSNDVLGCLTCARKKDHKIGPNMGWHCDANPDYWGPR